MTAPVVSVITPFFNAAPFFAESIDSVLAQTYQAWELLLVDDGAEDGSTEIARDYASRYPDRIAYIEHQGHANLGTSAALNTGLRHARGSLVALIDADDVWLPHKLAEQVALLNAHPGVGMLYGNSLFWHSWTGNPADLSRDYSPRLGVPLNAVSAPPALLVRCLSRRAAVPCPCSVLLRREVVEAVGGFEEAFRVTFSDQAFYTKVFLAAPVYVADRVWDKYRIHPGSAIAIAKRDGMVAAERARYLDYVARYLQEHDLARGEVWRVLQAERGRRRPSLATALGTLRRAARYFAARIAARVPESLQPRVRRRVHPPGGVRFGNMRRLTPLSRYFGCERGTPIDRRYIETFLARHAADINGRVLEIGDDAYTRRFGADRVTARDVLHIDADNEKATIVDDLASGERLPSNAFDCVILTQTLNLVFDVPAGVRTLHRILKPGGVALITVPGISQIDGGRWQGTWYWTFTPAVVRRLLASVFPTAEIQVDAAGNVFAACAFLQGMAQEELTGTELDAYDPLYPVIVTARARKPPLAS